MDQIAAKTHSGEAFILHAVIAVIFTVEVQLTGRETTPPLTGNKVSTAGSGLCGLANDNRQSNWDGL